LIVGTLDDGLKAFNFNRFYVSDSKPDARKQLWAILDATRTFPLIEPYRIIMVMGGEKVLGVLVKDDSGDDTAELAAFREYLAGPTVTTVLVVNVVSADERLSGSRALMATAVVVDCSPLGDSKTRAGDRRARAERWISASAKRAGVRMEARAVSLLAEYFNADIGRLRAEFNRLLMYASEASSITEQMANEVIGRQALSNTWALNDALEARDAGLALKELRLKLDEGEAPFMILGQLRAAVERFEDARRLPYGAELLFRTDLALKTSRGEPRVLLERLVVELCG
jgi:DNA polymerase III delta subunit